jgi:putative ubiquitin-RnfH superfamily antitoxin RatB of RatAB toxin-antitoxin module
MYRKIFTLLIAFAFLLGGMASAQKSSTAETGLANGKHKVIGKTTNRVVSAPASKAVILSEAFEGGVMPAGWSEQLGAATSGWTFSSDASSDYFDIPAHTTYAAINDDACNCDMSDVWLITPVIDLTGTTAPRLSFESYLNYGDDVFTLKSSIDGGVTWADVTTFTTKSAWTNEQVDLSAYAGQANFKLAFHYNDGGAWSYGWAIDDVSVFEPEANDLAVTAIAPDGFVLSGSTVTPQVTISNPGTNAQTTWNVTLTDGVGYTSMRENVAIAAGAALVVDMDTWTPVDGTYNLTATVTLTSDANAANDVMTSSVEVREYQLGDVVMMFTTQAGAATGVETDGQFIYVQHWNNDVFDRYTMGGVFVETFTITGASSIRDLAFDGTYFYGAANNTSLRQLDFTQGAEALVSTITAPVNCRAIAYDMDDNTFWANSGSSDLTEFSVAGVATGRSFTPSVSIYGAAYDNYSDPANPTIWGSDWSGSFAKLIEWGLDGTATGREIDLTSQISGAGAAGLAIYVENNVAYLLADFQTDPNTVVKIFLVELPSTSTETDITAFSFTEQTGDATINATAHTVSIEVVHGTNVTALVPTITLSDGATVNPASGAAQDFTSPVVYTVTAEDGTTTQDWTVTVTIALANTETDITAFSFTEQTGDATINATAHTVSIEVVYGTSVTALVPTITLSDGATVNPASGLQQNFTTSVTYTVTAEDGTTTQDWTVNVTVAAASTETDITAFSFTEQTGVATINATAHTVSIEVAYGTSVTALVPTITLSAGATVSPASGVAQNFTAPVVYTVTAEDGTTTQAWTVTVTVAASTETDITAFSFTEQTGAATIDATAHTVSIEVVYGTNVTALVPTITLSAGATVSPASGAAHDFTAPVTYTVTAEDGTTTQAWTVTVTIATSVNDIASKGISVYPNPSNGVFTVNANEVYNLQVLDLTGKVISTQVLNENGSVSINNAGVYFLKFSNANNSFVQRVIVK